MQVPEEGKLLSRLKYSDLQQPQPSLLERIQRQESVIDEEGSETVNNMFRAAKLKARLKEVKSQLFHNKEIICLEMYEDVPLEKIESEHLDHPDELVEEEMSVESQGATKIGDSNNKPQNTSKLSSDTGQLSQSQNISAGMAKKLKEKKQEEEQKIIQIRNSFESREYPKEFRYF